MRKFLSYSLLLGMFFSLQAVAEPFIVNIDSRLHTNQGNAISLQLDKGKYTVIPLSEDQGAVYTAVNRFQVVEECTSSNNNCRHGWEHSYSIAIGNTAAVTFGCGSGHGPLDCGAYYPTAIKAFQNAESTEFTLSNPTTIKLFWLDDYLLDNEGGISLLIKKKETACDVVSDISELTHRGLENHINYFRLILKTASTSTARVNYTTRDGTAIADTDYIATSGTAIIPAGETEILIGVEIIGTNTIDPNKAAVHFDLVLSNPQNGVFPNRANEIVKTHYIVD